MNSLEGLRPTKVIIIYLHLHHFDVEAVALEVMDSADDIAATAKTLSSIEIGYSRISDKKMSIYLILIKRIHATSIE